MKEYELIPVLDDISSAVFDASEDIILYLSDIDFDVYYEEGCWEALALALKEIKKHLQEMGPIPSLALLPYPSVNPQPTFSPLLAGIIKTIYMRTYYYYMNQRHRSIEMGSYNYSYAL